MSNKKQTAVQWLEAKVDGMIKNGGDSDLLAVIEHIQQAKAIEKEQIIDASTIGFADGLKYMNNETQNFENAEQYYKETYDK
jgi:hypothetical protein